MPRLNRKLSRSGFSLVELIVSLSLIALSAGVVLTATTSSRDTIVTGSVLAELDSRGNSALDAIAGALSLSRRDDVLPAAPAAEAPFFATSLDFQITEYVADEVILDDVARISFEYAAAEIDDGIDNDGNGLIDEGQVVFTTDLGLASQRRRVLCRDVAELAASEFGANGLDDNGNGLLDEAGLSFEFDGDRVTVRLTLETTDSRGAVFSREFERTLAFRK